MTDLAYSVPHLRREHASKLLIHLLYSTTKVLIEYCNFASQQIKSRQDAQSKG